MESRRKRSRSQRLKWGCYILLLVVCTVLQTMPGLFQFGAAKPLWLLPLCLAVSAAEGEFAGAIFGAVCGLMGLLLTAGTDHTLTTTIVGGRGFTAVMVSWMAKFNPIIMVFTSLLLVVLGRGASEISSTFGLNQSFSDILTGIILFFIIGSEFFITYQVSLRKGGKKEA